MPAIVFDPVLFQQGIDAFAKTLTYIPVTKTISNDTGDETLTQGTSSQIRGALYQGDDGRKMEVFGQIKMKGDAVLLVRPTVTINKDDLIQWDSETFRVDTVKKRWVGGTFVYVAHDLFLIT